MLALPFALKPCYIRPCSCGKILDDCAVKPAPHLLFSPAQPKTEPPTITATGQEGKCRVCPTRTSQHARGTVDRSGQWTGQDRVPAVLRQRGAAAISLIERGDGAWEMKGTVCLAVLD